MKDSRRFYKELGNLFYAIVAADKHISPKEKKIMDEEVQFAWRHYDHTSDRYGTDLAFLIEFEFETMEDFAETSENAFLSFEQFYYENEAAIDHPTRNRIFNSARHIAESVRKVNHEELSYLVRLKNIMKV